MEGPFSWDDAALEVIEAGAKGPEETLALVVDRSRGFRLSCSSVVLYRGSGDDFPKSFDDLTWTTDPGAQVEGRCCRRARK
ncbi:hypothetical protein ACLESD_22090 [Pyxidicoccus sp. 3LFB2]